jgi:hypothetical protein
LFDYLTRLSLEADVGDRKVKREAQSRAYWLGHTMTRFQGNESICKVCNASMTLHEGKVHGNAIQESCAQKLLPIVRS